MEKIDVLLRCEGLTKRFGGVIAVNNFSFDLKENEILGIIGPNGAGKTTVLNLISGHHKPSHGTILFHGRRIDGLPPNIIAKIGIARTFQIPRPFKSLTVFQNLLISAINSGRFNSRSSAEKEVEKVLHLVGLENKRNWLAGNLTTAELRRLELGRALCMRPKLLLSDEVAAGLREHEIPEMLSIFKMLKDMGLSVIVVEHVMPFLMKIAERVIVMHLGEKLAEGTPEEISRDDRVVEVYLGRKGG